MIASMGEAASNPALGSQRSLLKRNVIIETKTTRMSEQNQSEEGMGRTFQIPRMAYTRAEVCLVHWCGAMQPCSCGMALVCSY